MNFLRLFTRRPVTTIMIFGMFMLFGVYSYLKLAKDQFPKIDVPYIAVITVYPGAGPEEVETQVTEKIEEAVASVSGLKKQTSTSQDGLSMVVAEFELSVDGDLAENDVRSEIDQIINDLPSDAKKPTVAQFDLSALPIAQLAVLAPRPAEDIYQVVDEHKLMDRLTQVQGLAKVELFGKKEREIVLSVSSKRLEAFGLSILDLDNLIAAYNLKLPAGRVIEGEQEINVKLQGEFPSLEAIEQLEIPIDGGVIRLADVATVQDTYEEVRSIARMNGQTAIGLSLTKSSSANTLEIMKNVQKLLAKFRQELPEDFQIIVANDKSTVINDSIADVFSNLIAGIALTALVLLLFLHDVRLTVIATISLPIAIIATFMVVLASGFTANMMSLMALALSVGVLVANVIVVLENIQRHLHEGAPSPLEAAENGTTEIVVSVFGSALTNLAVFFPIATMSSLVGQFFTEFGMTTVYATLFSLLISFTLTPMLAAKLLKKQDERKQLGWFPRQWERMYSACERLYARTLTWSLRFRWLTLLATAVVFFGSFVSMKWIGGEFITKADEGQLNITVEKAVDESLEGTAATVTMLEERLKALPYVQLFYTEIGGGEESETGVNEATIAVKLVGREQRALNTIQIAAELRRMFADIPGVKLTIQSVDSTPGGNDKPVSVDVSGQNMEELFAVSEQLMEALRAMPGAVDVDMNWRLGKPEVRVTPDYRRCADYNISPAQLALILRASFTGSVGSVYRVEGEEYDIRVQLSEEDRMDAATIGALPIAIEHGMVRLDALARIEMVEGPSKIYRTNRMRSVTIGANTAPGANVNGMTTALQAKIDAMQLPTGMNIAWAGDTERMQETFVDMSVALFLAIALTYMLLSILLESAIHSLTIMSTIPLALIGVLTSLAITGKTLNMFSLMGVVMLVGIVVNNGLLLIDYIQELRRKGENWRDIIVQACAVKLRPVLMTNVAIIVSMIPMALGQGQGGEMRSPMAVVSIGGMFTSTVMTMYIVPVLYSLIEGAREWIARRRAVAAEPAVAPQDAVAAQN